jgi:hypothetical protein
MLGSAVVHFNTATQTVAPQFAVNGTEISYATIGDFYGGITVSWNGATGDLTLAGPASAADYQAAIRLLTAGTGGSLQNDVTLTVRDMAGNAAPTVSGIQVVPRGAAGGVSAPNQTVSITGLADDVGASQGNIASGGATDDRSLLVSGTLSAPLAPGQVLAVFDNGVRLDGVATVNETTWSFQDPRVVTGNSVSFTARVVDISGNNGPLSTPAYTATFTLGAPNLSTVTDNFAPFLGSVSNGGATNDNRPVLSGGGATVGLTIGVYDGAALIGTTVVPTGGTWALQVPVNLEEGEHDFTAAYILDAAGNLGAPSAVFNVTVDKEAPLAPVLGSVNSGANAIPDGATIAPATLTLSGTVEAGVSVIVRDGTTELGTATVTGTTWSFNVSNLLDGGHNFNAIASDGAGNTSPPSNGIAIGINSSPVDTKNSLNSAPIISSISDDVGGLTGDLRNGGVTDDARPTLHGVGAQLMTLNGQEQIFGTVNIYDGATKIGSTLADASGAWSFTPAADLAGEHSFSAKQLYNGAESLASGEWTVTVDTAAAPTPTITNVIDNVVANFGTVANNALTNDSSPTITGGNAGAGAQVNVYDSEAGLLGTTLADGSGNWAFNIVIGLSEGPHGITAQAVSVTGNQGTASAARNFTVDTVPPAAPGFTAATDTGLPGFTADGVTSDNTQTLSGVSETGATITIYDGVQLLGSTVAATGGAWSFTSAALPDGEHRFNATATDTAGNISVLSQPVLVTVDATNPRVVIGDLAVSMAGDGEQVGAQTARLNNGGWVTVWSSNQSSGDGDGYGVFMRLFDPAGNPMTSEDVRVNTQIASDQVSPQIAVLTNGSYVVTWQSALQDGGGYGVYMQRFNANGTPAGAETRVNSTVAGDQDTPQIAALSGGNYAIVWNSTGQDGDLGGVYMRVFNPTGGQVLAETLVNQSDTVNYTAGDQFVKDIEALTGDRFVVSWSRSTSSSDVFSIYNGAGVRQQGPIVMVNPPAGGNASSYPNRFEATSDGGFVYIYESGVNGDYPRYFSRFNSTGVQQGTYVLLQDNVRYVTITDTLTLSTGNIALAWSAGNAVHVQVINASTGAAVGAEIIISRDTTVDNSTASLINVAGGFLVSWQTNAGGNYNIVSHEFTNAGLRVDEISDLQFADANDLTRVTVAFASAVAAPVFRTADGFIPANNFTAIQQVYGITVTLAGNTLTLSGAASADVYEYVLHMLTTGTAGTRVSAVITTTDLAGNVTTTNGINVDPAGTSTAGGTFEPLANNFLFGGFSAFGAANAPFEASAFSAPLGGGLLSAASSPLPLGAAEQRLFSSTAEELPASENAPARDPYIAVIEEFVAALEHGSEEALELFIARHNTSDPLVERAEAVLDELDAGIFAPLAQDEADALFIALLDEFGFTLDDARVETWPEPEADAFFAQAQEASGTASNANGELAQANSASNGNGELAQASATGNGELAQGIEPEASDLLRLETRAAANAPAETAEAAAFSTSATAANAASYIPGDNPGLSFDSLPSAASLENSLAAATSDAPASTGGISHLAALQQIGLFLDGTQSTESLSALLANLHPGSSPTQASPASSSANDAPINFGAEAITQMADSQAALAGIQQLEELLRQQHAATV